MCDLGGYQFVGWASESSVSTYQGIKKDILDCVRMCVRSLVTSDQTPGSILNLNSVPRFLDVNSHRSLLVGQIPQTVSKWLPYAIFKLLYVPNKLTYEKPITAA